MALISVLMPVYNSEKYLNETLSSLHNQSFSDFEVLIIDDGSTDGTARVCSEWCNLDGRFKYYFQENGGGGVARNTAIEIAMSGSSKYIAWVDSDDIVSTDYLDILVTIAEKGEFDIVQCGFCEFRDSIPIIIQESNQRPSVVEVSAFNGKDLEESLLRGGVDSSVLWNKLWRKSLYADCRITLNERLSGRIHDDENIIWKLYLEANGVAVIDSVLYGYRLHDDSVQHTAIKVRSLETFEIWLNRWTYYKDHSLHEFAQIASEKILFVYALLLSFPYSNYEDWASFFDYAKVEFERVSYATKDARRADLVLLGFVANIWFGVFRIYGLIYRGLKKNRKSSGC